MKKYAFTLAEVLITLGIIGFIAAMTLPALIQKQIEKHTVTRVKKAYSTIANAYRAAQYEYGDNFRKEINWMNSEGRVKFLDKIRPFLDIAIDCKAVEAAVCFPKLNNRLDPFYYPYLERRGTDYLSKYKNSAVILKDGTMIIIFDSPHNNMHAVQILVDINGPSKPNHYGHDTFFFFIEDSSKNQLLGKRPISGPTSCQRNSRDYAYGCADLILKNDNMDYLRK